MIAMNGMIQPSRLKPCVGGEAKRRQASFFHEGVNDRLVGCARLLHLADLFRAGSE